MKKPGLPNLISILILTLITSIMWISFSVYRALTTQPAPTVPKNISAPLTPSLDQDTINQINQGVFFSESEIPQVTIVSSSQPLPTIAPVATPVGLPSASPEASPSASPGTI